MLNKLEITVSFLVVVEGDCTSLGPGGPLTAQLRTVVSPGGPVSGGTVESVIDPEAGH